MGIVESIVGVFTKLIEWFSTALVSVGEIFYNADTGLTFIGTLSVIGVGIAVVLMVISMLQSFLHFRG